MMKPEETGQNPKKRGRPSGYSVQIADAICERIAAGEGLRTICAALGIAQSPVFVWLTAHPEFAEKYARARESQAELYASEIVSIADEASDSDSAQVARVRIDARKWFASKVAPKKYGDKVGLVGPDGDGPLEVIVRKIGGDNGEA